MTTTTFFLRCKLAQATTVFVRSDAVVIGHDPEFADMSNPRGEIIGYCASIFADAPDGSRWVYTVRSWTGRYETVVVELAEKVAERFEAALRLGHRLTEGLWREDRPVYGSEAYEHGGWSQQDADEEKARDEFEWRSA